MGILGSFGFRDGAFSDNLFGPSSSEFRDFRRAKHPSRHFNFPRDSAALQLSLGAFVAGFDLSASAGNCLEQFKARSEKLQRRFKTRSRLCQSFSAVGQPIHGNRGFELVGNWRCCLLSLGSLSLWTQALERNHRVQNDSKITMAFYAKSPERSGGSNSKRRFWTNVLIGMNVLIFVAQEASHGRLLLLGAKINNLIDQGQLWRFITPAFLHANLGHLLTNCYSLNSVGPVIEAQGGATRFLVVYAGSAITGFAMSYFFNRAPAVGASGAVFGLVGSLAVFLIRHRHILSGAQRGLDQIARVIAINLVLGIATNNIDNWGHLGGLMGGAAISWLLGPAFAFRHSPGAEKSVLVDQPPISYLLPKAKTRSP